MTIGHPRRWPGYPHHTGLISAAMTDVIATYSSNPRFRHQLSSDPASRRTPLPRRMVPVITVHGGLAPLECISLLDTPARIGCPTKQFRWFVDENSSHVGSGKVGYKLVVFSYFFDLH